MKVDQFTQLIDRGIDIAEARLQQKRAGSSDPLSEEQLKAIIENLRDDKATLLNGSLEPSNGNALFGPLKAAIDWGEPEGSPLRRILYELVLFYQQNF